MKTTGTEVLNGVPLDWAIFYEAGCDLSKVLYYFHANNGNASSFEPFYDDMAARWAILGIAPPVGIGVSYGPKFTLSDMPSAYVAGAPILFAHFVDHTMPFLDAKAVQVASGGSQAAFSGTRRLYGASMGGYNAGLLATKQPTLWAKVVLGCPGLFTLNPWSTQAQKDAYVARNSGCLLASVNAGLALIGADYPVLSDWNRNNPHLWANSLTPVAPPFYVWWNTMDEMGLKEGAGFIATIMQNKGVAVTTRSNGLTHCGQGETLKQQVAEFLA